MSPHDDERDHQCPTPRRAPSTWCGVLLPRRGVILPACASSLCAQGAEHSWPGIGVGQGIGLWRSAQGEIRQLAQVCPETGQMAERVVFGFTT